MSKSGVVLLLSEGGLEIFEMRFGAIIGGGECKLKLVECWRFFWR